ncbi:MAG: hypothetical protein JXR69_00280 [Candidatus Delongbacteria bacterium]|nr:hypothetical protein [Candidatus Delongbacteria bacterium]
MKNFTIIILLINSILFSGELIFKYNFEKPEVIDRKVFLEDCDRSNIAFSPSLVLKQVRLLLPDGEKAVSYKVSYSKPVIFEEKYDISPVEASGRLSVNPPAGIQGKRSEVYSINEFYPSKINSDRFFTQYKSGHPIFMTIIYPVQYNPVTKDLRYYSDITLTITTESNQKSAKLVRSSKKIESLIKAIVDNPQQVNLSSISVKSETDYDYLIITPDIFTGSFRDFTNFNLRRGLKTTIKSVESILIEMTGNDDQDKIRNYIIQEYTNNNITYVLLAGDTDYIPHRGFRSEIMDYGTDYYDETDIPADMYYGCLDGTWQLPASSYFGEPGSEDLLWEVYVSRFSVGNTTELTNMIQKTIQYSEQPVTGRITNNLLVGELLWEEGGGEGWVDSYGGDCMDELVDYCDHNSYETTGFDTNWTNSELYDRDLGYWYKTDLFTKIKNEDITWIDHLGHSNNTYNMRMTNSDIKNSNFDNDGTSSNPFVIYSQGCYSGAFDNRTTTPGSYTIDCIGEAFVVFARAAVAYIGNSRYGLGSPYDTDGSGQRFHRYFHHATFDQDITKIEQMNAYSKEINAPLILEEDINLGPYFGQCKWIAYCVNVLGDPALDIWTSEPLTMTINTLETVGFNSIPTIPVETDVPGATIAVFFEGNYLYSITADLDGNAEHSMPESIGLIEYYITAHNYLQGYDTTEIVTAPDSPSNVVTNIVLDTFNMDWDTVTDANSYIIYGSDDPYGNYSYITTVDTNSWSTTIDSNVKKFYHIVASSEPLK